MQYYLLSDPVANTYWIKENDEVSGKALYLKYVLKFYALICCR